MTDTTTQPESDLKLVDISQVDTTGGTQMRTETEDPEVIDDYVLAIQGEGQLDPRNHGVMPPVICFWDGKTLWLADGFYRLSASIKAGEDKIWAVIYRGTLDTARWYACATNQSHGVRRTYADKRKAVGVAMAHVRGKDMPNRELARWVGVAESFVRKIKTENAEAAALCAQVEAAPPKEDTPEVSPGEAGAEPEGTPPPTGPPAPADTDDTAGDGREEEVVHTPPDPPPAPASADLPPNQGDAADEDVPEQLIPIFETRGEFHGIEAELRRCASRIQALASGPAGRSVCISDVDMIAMIADRVKSARPFMVDVPLEDDDPDTPGWSTVEEAELDTRDIESF